MGLADTVSQALGTQQQRRSTDIPPQIAAAAASGKPFEATQGPDGQIEFQRGGPSSGGLASTVQSALASASDSRSSAPAGAEPPPDNRKVGDKMLDAYWEGVTAVPKAAANTVTGVGSSILGGWKGLATLAAGGSLSDAAQAVQETTQRGTYQPEGAGGQVAKVANLPGEALGYVGQKAGQTVMDIGEAGTKAGLPPELMPGPKAAATVETGANVLPMLLTRGQVKRDLATIKDRSLGTRTLTENVPALAADTTNYDVPTVARRGTVPALTNAPGESLPPPAVRGREPAFAAQPATAPPKFELDQQSGAVQPQPAVKFGEGVEIAPPGKPLPAEEVARRQAALNAVGITEARKSALTGDMTEANTEAQISLRGDEAGKLMKAKLDAEREALTAHAESIVQKTGGTLGTGQSELIARGNVIAAPFDALKTAIDAQTKKFYAESKVASGDAISADAFRAVTADDSAFLGTTEGEALLKGLRARAKSLGMDAESNPTGTISVETAERMRQWLGEKWTPRTSRFIGQLKDALDDDVTRGGGQDIYAKARAMRAMRSTIFENDVIDAQGRPIPNGVGKLFDASGKSLKLLKDEQQIPDAVAGLHAGELAHLIRTLQVAENLSPEIGPLARAALSEIKAQFANKILESGSKRVGQWGSRDVTTYLNNNSARLPQLFSKEELGSIGALNEAGNILRIEKGYPGSSVQAENIGRAMGEHAIESIGTGAGALVGHSVGAPTFGAKVGNMLTLGVMDRMKNAARMRAVQDRFVRLSDVAPK